MQHDQGLRVQRGQAATSGSSSWVRGSHVYGPATAPPPFGTASCHGHADGEVARRRALSPLWLRQTPVHGAVSLINSLYRHDSSRTTHFRSLLARARNLAQRVAFARPRLELLVRPPSKPPTINALPTHADMGGCFLDKDTLSARTPCRGLCAVEIVPAQPLPRDPAGGQQRHSRAVWRW